MKIFKHAFLVLFLAFSSLRAESNEEAPWTGVMRVKALESLDRLLAIAFDQKSRSCLINESYPKEQFLSSNHQLQLFVKNYGYFSPTHPLVAKVTEESQDIALTEAFLVLIHTYMSNPEEHRLATAEVLTKVLAYRDLKEEQEVSIPLMIEDQHSELVPYVVDKVFDLWHGMPAYGLIPKQQGRAAPLLLFRGTDLTLSTERGWASVFSDLNTAGPGYVVFKNAQKEIHLWLEKAARGGQKAQVMGFSLGGVLAMYTALYEQEYINAQKKFYSLAFNPPGVSRKTFEKFSQASRIKRIPLQMFITRGDLVSKIGFLVGDVREFSVKRFLRPIAAHTILMCAQPLYFLSVVDVDKENQTRGL